MSHKPIVEEDLISELIILTDKYVESMGIDKFAYQFLLTALMCVSTACPSSAERKIFIENCCAHANEIFREFRYAQ